MAFEYEGTAPGEGSEIIGKVASPPQQQATSDQFHFWIPPDRVVEKTQIVRTDSAVGKKPVRFYAIVDEVFRQSRKRHMSEEYDAFDGDVGYEPPLHAGGMSYAMATILRAEPPVLAPPMEESPVFLGAAEEARRAYGADEVEHPLPIGLVKNGGDAVAGPGVIDLDYLLGQNGGHMNVNGVAGRGTKSSFLLFTLFMLLDEARRQAVARPSDPERLRVVPILFNVKGYDLFHIDRWSKKWDPERHLKAWRPLGIAAPSPFTKATFYAPQQPRSTISTETGRTGPVAPYSYSLADVIERGLFTYLFAEEDVHDATFGTLVLHLEDYLSDERLRAEGGLRRSLREGEGRPRTFEDLLEWVKKQADQKDGDRQLTGHAPGTWAKLRRRVLRMVLEGAGVLRIADLRGKPLSLSARDTVEPQVVDLNGLSGMPALQRFVIAATLRQLIDERTGSRAVHGLRYLIGIDELNRFAPHGARDPVTQLFELVAAEMRSQGIILLGAQQQASQVSAKVIENAGIRVLGRTGSLELGQPVWRALSQSTRSKAGGLPVDEKLILQDSFRAPMHVRIPFPPWAMRREEAAPGDDPGVPDDLPGY
jgi:DNA helicase HerA-like ATPase